MIDRPVDVGVGEPIPIGTVDSGVERLVGRPGEDERLLNVHRRLLVGLQLLVLAETQASFNAGGSGE